MKKKNIVIIILLISVLFGFGIWIWNKGQKETAECIDECVYFSGEEVWKYKTQQKNIIGGFISKEFPEQKQCIEYCSINRKLK